MPADAREHVALVGLSGSGKTEVAPLVAAALDVAVVDLDERISAASGRSVGEIFRDEGESGFRRLESAALAAALDGPASVVATGGGVVLAATNRDRLRRRCRVVWLRTPVDRLVERLASGTAERPLLSEDVRTTLCAQQAEREALYAEVATHVVETDGLDPAEVARLVVQEVTGG